MQQQHQKSTAIAAAVSSAISDQPHKQMLYTVEQMAAEPRHSTVGIIPGNGLIECGAIVRVGRKVLIHRAKFLHWVTQ